MPAPPNPAGLSPIVAGAWRLADWGWTPRERLAWITANLDLGVSSIDHADSYRGAGQVEPLLGEALALAPGLRPRLQLVGTCSLPMAPAPVGKHAVARSQGGLSQPGVQSSLQPGVQPDEQPVLQPEQLGQHLQAAVARSLAHLHTDHLDLLLLHCPAPSPPPDASGAGGPSTCAHHRAWADALAQACLAVQRAGLVRCFGLSQGSAALQAGLQQSLPLAAHQVAYSLLQQAPLHDGSLAHCQQLGLRPLAWAPLAGGRLFTGQDPAAMLARAALQAMAQALGVSPTTLAIAWVAQHPSHPLPLLGSRRSAVVREALAGLQLRLAPAQWQQLAQAAVQPAGA